jgi:hypothetical protein
MPRSVAIQLIGLAVVSDFQDERVQGRGARRMYVLRDVLLIAEQQRMARRVK